MTQLQGAFLGAALIVVIIIVNVANGFIIYKKVVRINTELSKQLNEVSKKLLISSGYLKDK